MGLKEIHHKAILEIICFLFILLFVFAGLTKVLEGPSFYTNLLNAPIMGGSTMAAIFSRAIPLAELIVALLLCLQSTRITGLYGAVVVLGGISIYTGVLLLFAPYTPCSCGGITSRFSFVQHLLLSGTALLLAIWALWYTRNKNVKSKKGKEVSKQ